MRHAHICLGYRSFLAGVPSNLTNAVQRPFVGPASPAQPSSLILAAHPWAAPRARALRRYPAPSGSGIRSEGPAGEAFGILRSSEYPSEFSDEPNASHGPLRMKYKGKGATSLLAGGNGPAALFVRDFPRRGSVSRSCSVHLAPASALLAPGAAQPRGSTSGPPPRPRRSGPSGCRGSGGSLPPVVA